MYGAEATLFHSDSGGSLKMNRLWWLAGVALVPLSFYAVSGMRSKPAGVPDTHWSSHGGTPDESGFAALDSISKSNVGKLGLAWSLDLPGEASLEATPLAVDGVLYFTGSYAAVYAVEVASGKLLWKYDPQTWKHKPHKMHFSFGVNRGAAYADGRVFVAALRRPTDRARCKSGKLLWVVETIARSR